MIKIVEKQFEAEITGNLPITKVKAQECYKTLIKKGYNTTIAAVQSQALRLRTNFNKH